MKWYIGLAAFGFAVLACAAVWFGGLNQDEGWYLYAANLVAEGRVPYRDFFFTQGPVMPIFYSAFAWVWRSWGLLGARIFTLTLGAFGILFASGLARRVAPVERRNMAALLVALLLGCNLYHIYYLAIPKTYALAGLFVIVGFYLLTFEGPFFTFASALCLAMAAGTRISLGVLMLVVVAWLPFRGPRRSLLWFLLGGVLGLALVYGPFLFDADAFKGLCAAWSYHTAREGFDVAVVIGSISRLVRWYFPLFVLLGLGFAAGPIPRGAKPLLIGFAAVFVAQMLAPFPYEDYHVPVIALIAAAAAVMACEIRLSGRDASIALLVLGMAWAGSFGSPLLEKWTTNGQDRFWVLKKPSSELAQLRAVAKDIESLDPGGGDILTQDIYLAIETNRKVPVQMSMGPFSYWGDTLPYDGAEKVVLDDAGMEALLDSAPCEIAAMSGYTFAITAPSCRQTPMDRQIELWSMLKRRYNRLFTEEDFGQNSTPLLILKKKHGQ